MQLGSIKSHSDNLLPKSVLPDTAEANRKKLQFRDSLAGSAFSDLSNKDQDGETSPLRLLAERMNGTALHKL